MSAVVLLHRRAKYVCSASEYTPDRASGWEGSGNYICHCVIARSIYRLQNLTRARHCSTMPRGQEINPATSMHLYGLNVDVRHSKIAHLSSGGLEPQPATGGACMAQRPPGRAMIGGVPRPGRFAGQAAAPQATPVWFGKTRKHEPMKSPPKAYSDPSADLAPLEAHMLEMDKHSTDLLFARVRRCNAAAKAGQDAELLRQADVIEYRPQLQGRPVHALRHRRDGLRPSFPGPRNATQAARHTPMSSNAFQKNQIRHPCCGSSSPQTSNAARTDLSNTYSLSGVYGSFV